MRDKKIKDWVKSVIQNIPEFLNKLKDDKVAGRFQYSLSGDIKIPLKWGLGNTVFAAKTYYMLNRMELADKHSMSKFIKSFQSQNTYISDIAIQALSLPHRVYISLRTLDFKNIL
jgi:hypothetical protein